TGGSPVLVSGSGAVYTVTVSGISGNGSLGLNLIDDGSIRDQVGLPLRSTTGAVAFAGQVTYATSTKPSSLAAADFTGDGKPDLIAALSLFGNLNVLLGNGDGTFQTATTWGSGLSYAISVTAADVNGDGKLDLETADFTGPNIGVLLGNGDGTFQN